MTAELTEVLDRILQAKKLAQAELGERIGASQSVVSKMRTGSDWATHWQIFLKLLPMCIELDLIAERDLLPPRHARESNSGHHKASAFKSNSGAVNMAKALKLYIYENKYPRRKYQQDREIGFRLRDLRLASYNPKHGRYFFQTELAKELRTSQSNIKNYELSLRKIPHKMLEKYGDFFKVSIDWILTGQGIGPKGKAT